MIRTVLGDISPQDLGITLAHEHLVCAITPEQTIRPADVPEDLDRYRRCGGRAIVELTNTGMGQEAATLPQLSRQSGLHIICGTGFYLQRYHPSWLHDATPAELETFMVREIDEGVAGTGVRAGVIGEIGTSREEITPDEAKVIGAAARAARRTGAPLSTHTSFGRFALEQLDLIAAAGLPLSRVSVGHLDLNPDPDYHTAVARRGAYVQYDTFGKNQYQPDSERVACVAEMVRRGFTAQILLANDISRPTYLTTRGGWGYCHLLETIVPALPEAGVDGSAIHAMLVENPARFLTFQIDDADVVAEPRLCHARPSRPVAPRAEQGSQDGQRRGSATTRDPGMAGDGAAGLRPL